jgi:hypothetical protein
MRIGKPLVKRRFEKCRRIQDSFCEWVMDRTGPGWCPMIGIVIRDVETSISASQVLFVVCYFVRKALQPNPCLKFSNYRGFRNDINTSYKTP